MPVKVTVETNGKPARVYELDKAGKPINSWVIPQGDVMCFEVRGKESLKVKEE